jgi:hydrogenase expression/formation protein HypD
MGFWEYEPIAEKYQLPIVVTGFEPIDILQGILETVEMLENGEWGVRNRYSRSVQREGNQRSQEIIDQVFHVTDRKWRGIGTLPESGYTLRSEFEDFDAARKFSVGDIHTEESAICMSGEVLQGLKRPTECPAFGRECTPETPLGATMVSSEGACAAYYRYHRYKELA